MICQVIPARINKGNNQTINGIENESHLSNLNPAKIPAASATMSCVARPAYLYKSAFLFLDELSLFTTDASFFSFLQK